MGEGAGLTDVDYCDPRLHEGSCGSAACCLVKRRYGSQTRRYDGVKIFHGKHHRDDQWDCGQKPNQHGLITFAQLAWNEVYPLSESDHAQDRWNTSTRIFHLLCDVYCSVCTNIGVPVLLFSTQLMEKSSIYLHGISNTQHPGDTVAPATTSVAGIGDEGTWLHLLLHGEDHYEHNHHSKHRQVETPLGDVRY